ncbi:MAG: glutathione S-transferase family protein [Rhodothalassiaceae bacterium]
MGLLVEGKWQDKWYETDKHGGRFVRPETKFRNRIDEAGAHPPEAGRYHLYVSYACPWAHRTLIARALKGLDHVMSVSVVHSHMDSEGWRFDPSEDGATEDHVNGFDRLHQVYTAAQSVYTGRVTVPVLWDSQAKTIVNNESAEILRILNADFNGLAADPELDLYPEALQDEIDKVNERVYHSVNNGVYKAGFATSQEAYEEAFGALFETLDWLDVRLGSQRYLAGDAVTEADWRLFTTLIRFDAVYVGHFKCNRQRIADYDHLSAYLRELYQWPGVKPTVRLDHIKNHYYGSHPSINPTGIVPKGPDLDLDAPHRRDQL